MFKHKFFHPRRGGGCGDDGWGRLRRPGRMFNRRLAGFVRGDDGWGAAPYDLPERASARHFLASLLRAKHEMRQHRCRDVSSFDSVVGKAGKCQRRPGGSFAIQNKAYIISIRGVMLPALMLIASMWLGVTAASAAPANAGTSSTVHHVSVSHSSNSNADLIRRMVRSGRLAPTVHVLNSLPPTTITQFPLVPSSIKNAFPQATGLVTIVRGDRDNAFSDTVTVDVQNMPPNITFTIFYIEFASKPFGNVEYVADLTTRGDGSGETIFQNIAFVAFAMDARNPGTSQDVKEGTTSGINLEHMGMWFSQLQDAQKVLNDDTLKGTIFDGGNPPLHAGPQAMTDGQTAPVF